MAQGPNETVSQQSAPALRSRTGSERAPTRLAESSPGERERERREALSAGVRLQLRARYHTKHGKSCRTIRRTTTRKGGEVGVMGINAQSAGGNSSGEQSIRGMLSEKKKAIVLFTVTCLWRVSSLWHMYIDPAAKTSLVHSCPYWECCISKLGIIPGMVAHVPNWIACFSLHSTHAHWLVWFAGTALAVVSHKSQYMP